MQFWITIFLFTNYFIFLQLSLDTYIAGLDGSYSPSPSFPIHQFWRNKPRVSAATIQIAKAKYPGTCCSTQTTPATRRHRHWTTLTSLPFATMHHHLTYLRHIPILVTSWYKSHRLYHRSTCTSTFLRWTKYSLHRKPNLMEWNTSHSVVSHCRVDLPRKSCFRLILMWDSRLNVHLLFRNRLLAQYKRLKLQTLIPKEMKIGSKRKGSICIWIFAFLLWKYFVLEHNVNCRKEEKKLY